MVWLLAASMALGSLRPCSASNEARGSMSASGYEPSWSTLLAEGRLEAEPEGLMPTAWPRQHPILSSILSSAPVVPCNGCDQFRLELELSRAWRTGCR